MAEHPPIACTLPPAEFAERRAGILEHIAADALEMVPLENGYALRFNPSDDLLARITEFIRQERSCCRFLQFELTLAPDEGPLWLRLTGPPGTRPFLETLLGASA